jgi:hypothetical protein
MNSRRFIASPKPKDRHFQAYYLAQGDKWVEWLTMSQLGHSRHSSKPDVTGSQQERTLACTHNPQLVSRHALLR